MEISEVRKDLMQKAYFKPKEIKYGGQSVAMIDTSCHLISTETGFEIKISEYRSMIKNKELAYTLFELYLQETVK